jgi:hypothetical protein
MFITDAPLPPGEHPNLAKLIPQDVPSVDHALEAAARVIRAGATVWRIEAPSQILDDPDSVVAACKARGLLPHNWES